MDNRFADVISETFRMITMLRDEADRVEHLQGSSAAANALRTHADHFEGQLFALVGPRIMGWRADRFSS